MSKGKKGSKRSRHKAAEGHFRVIGGRWRHRRFTFPALEGVRPTGDRIRETLFNWLQPITEGARCLDLFAGSGALGTEALSRGASSVVFVDTQRRLLADIEDRLANLGEGGDSTFICMDALDYLSGAGSPFDIVFLDPPFGSRMLPALCQMLEQGAWLAPAARIYIECEAGSPPEIPDGWTMLRSAKAGNVGYHLASGPGGP